MGRPAIAMAVAVAVFIVAAPLASAKKIASGNGSGPFAVAAASGTISHPKKIVLSLSASPAGSMTVFSSVACISKRFKTKSNGGSFTMAAPGTRTLKLPMKKATNCSVTASAGYSDVNQAASGGAITLKLTGKN